MEDVLSDLWQVLIRVMAGTIGVASLIAVVVFAFLFVAGILLGIAPVRKALDRWLERSERRRRRRHARLLERASREDQPNHDPRKR